MSEQPTFVLIHGAWAASWVWDSLRAVLQDQGYAVITPDMPGNSRNPATPEQITMAGCLRAVEDSCAGVSGPLLIAGHSGGGVIATQAAEALAERVAGVAYIAGMMLPSGLGFAELAAEAQKTHPEAVGIWPYLRWSEDRQWSSVPAETVCEVFLQDLPREQAMAAAQLFCAQPEGTRALVAEWTPERFGRLPRLYIEATQDRSVVLPVQRRMQLLVPGAEVVSLDCGHVPQVVATDAVADALLAFAS
ncbi:alpha/beta fold hydrolase [Halopseudomonas sabulinigri]|uniref:Alpha/beta fold hydrolase n=1 Tax=Halopseudomonas sabulinigri TaxID=472181 RepID=A0ABP9ZRU7_9GAMM